MSGELLFVKLGGSLITDKWQEATPRLDLLERLAGEVRAALEARPDLRLLLGHGSGSFGHPEASRYGTQAGVRTPEAWVGFARVGAAAARLNRLVVDTFLEAGVPVLSLQASASALARGGLLQRLALEPVERALEVGLVPLVFGDVAFDEAQGGTVLSTEDLFVHLAAVLRPARVLLAGNAPGVLDDEHEVIPEITPESLPEVAAYLRGSRYVDVTGGMVDKVERMVGLVQQVPGLRVRIFTGREPGNLRRAILDSESSLGTRIGG
ncbi:MAG: isopentenyl phosphate kinase [Anaerolineales bacterium]